ncbi:hypothetical protein VaNZ11_013903 [Volvox africanus]|uniref:EF-hand domain-containing protein n=1 Tax=Volvox africanus TaxID=51714 RepID=A0ABQ5SHD2_9CHLO|nr:hypothetical protein VaNZ11_013903 [Volvox africanus]
MFRRSNEHVGPGPRAPSNAPQLSGPSAASYPSWAPSPASASFQMLTPQTHPPAMAYPEPTGPRPAERTFLHGSSAITLNPASSSTTGPPYHPVPQHSPSYATYVGGPQMVPAMTAPLLGIAYPQHSAAMQSQQAPQQIPAPSQPHYQQLRPSHVQSAPQPAPLQPLQSMQPIGPMQPPSILQPQAMPAVVPQQLPLQVLTSPNQMRPPQPPMTLPPPVQPKQQRQPVIPVGQPRPLQPMQPLQPIQPLQPLQPMPPPLPPPNPLLVADLAAAAAAKGSSGGGPEAEPLPPPPPATAAQLLLPSASPMLREVVSEGRLYVLDTSSRLVYRDSDQAGVLERVGKWVQGAGVVFVPHLTEADFFSALRSFLSRRQLGLADLFAALDIDLDGALSAAELRALVTHVVPGAVPSDVAYLMALLDWDDDGYVSLADLLDADDLADQMALERAEGAASAWVLALQETSFILHSQRHHAQVVFRTLAVDVAAAAAGNPSALFHEEPPNHGRPPHQQEQRHEPQALLEPASLLRFLRVMRPELGPGEARYVMDHLLQGPGDNRRSLPQVLHTLHLADVAYSTDQQQLKQEPEGAMEEEIKDGSQQQQRDRRRQQQLQDTLMVGPTRPAPLGPSRLRRRGGWPREAVPRFFYHLGYYLRSCRLTLRELVDQFDSDGDGALDPGDVRRLLADVLPGATGAQTMYIRAAVSSPTAALITLQDLTRAVEQHDAEFTAGRDDATAAAAGFTPTSAFAAKYLQGAAAAAGTDGGVGGAAAAGAEAYLRQQQKYQHHQQQPADVLKWILELMARHKLQLATLLAQFDRDLDGVLDSHEASRLVLYAAAGRLLRQRPMDLALHRLLAEADMDHDGKLSYNDLRLALLSKQDSLAREHARQASEKVAAKAATATATELLGPSEPLMAPTLRRPPPSPPAHASSGGGDPDAMRPFWVAPEAAAAWPAGMAQYPGMRPPGTAVEEYDTTPYSPVHPTNPQDPFTLAFAARNPAASALPPSTLAVFPAPPLSPGHSGGDSWVGPMSLRRPFVFPGDIPLCDVEPLEVPLAPVEYLGIRVWVDPVSTLAYLPLPVQPRAPSSATSPEMGPLPLDQQEHQLHLFGRLLPNGTLERVETPLSAQLFAALDYRLRTAKARLEDIWTPAITGASPPSLPPSRNQRSQPGTHAAAAVAVPPADVAALARFLGPLLPGLTVTQVVYLAALFDLDGDGLVFPDDVVMAFEEIGTAINTSASKLNAQAYKLLARVAGAVLGDYAESYRAFVQYSNRMQRARQERKREKEERAKERKEKQKREKIKKDKKAEKGDKEKMCTDKGKEKKENNANKKEKDEKKKKKEKKEKKKRKEKTGKKEKDMQRKGIAGPPGSDDGSSAKTVSSEDGKKHHRRCSSRRNSSSSSSSSSSSESSTDASDEDISELEGVELTQPQLARFLSHLTNHSSSPSDVGALIVYLNLKLAAADGGASVPAGSPAAAAIAPGPNQPYGNPYGIPQPYRQLRDTEPMFDWAFLVGVLRGAETSFPVDRRHPSPPGSRRVTREREQAREKRQQQREAKALAKAAAKAAAEADARAAEMRAAEALRAVVEQETAEDEERSREGGRSSPLRVNALTLPPAPHPDRRLVDLRFHVHTDGRTFLLDVVTGLLYVASPYILAVSDAVAEAGGARPSPTVAMPYTHGGVGRTRLAGPPVLSPRLLGAGGVHVGRGVEVAGSYHASGGGSAQALPPAPPPPLLLPYPDLAGKLQYPDNRLLPAQSSSGVGLVCRALERLLAEEHRASALYKVLDRDGRGLDLRRLHQLISDAASLTFAEVAFAAVLLDRRGSGRVTLADLREAAQTVHYTAAALGASPSTAPPVTLTLARVGARALDVLHRAAQVLQREARLLWLLVTKAGAAGTGQLERATAESLLWEVLQPYLPPHEIRVATAYLAMMTPDKDGNVTADEVIQLLRAVPMCLRLPYSDPVAVAGAGGTTARAAGREIIFAAGFGGPVAADGTLPLIQPSVPGGGGNAVISPYNKKLRHPTGPTDVEPELLYGPNDGAVYPDVNMPSDPDWGDGPYGREADAMARMPPRRRMANPFGQLPQPDAAAQQRAQEAAGTYGLFDDTHPDLYDDPQPSSLLQGARRQKPQAPVSELPRPLPPGPTRISRRTGSSSAAAAAAATADPFSLQPQHESVAALGSTSVSMSLQEEADLLNKLRGRPPRRLQHGGNGGGTAAGYENSTQYGLLRDLDPPPALEGVSRTELRVGGGGSGAGERYGRDDLSPAPTPPLPRLPPGLPEMPFVGPSPRLPDMSPRPPERPVGPSRRMTQAGAAGGPVYDSSEALAERPSALRTSPAVGGGAPAQVLSFLDGDDSSSGVDANSIDDVSGRGSGGGSSRRRRAAAVSGSLHDASAVAATGFDPYGIHDDDLVNAGSVPSSRPMTAATLARNSTADMPRLASPALESLLGPGHFGGAQIGSEASAGDAAGGEDDDGAYDPYSSITQAPGKLVRRLSGRLDPALSDAGAVTSASGPALFTSFGDAFRDGSARPGSGSAGRGSDDGGLGGTPSSSLLPPPSFRTTHVGTPASARSRLAKSTTAEEDYDEYDDPYAEDNSAVGADLSALVSSPQGDGGGGSGGNSPGEGGSIAGGGSGMFNTSIRSQTATSPLGMSIRSGGAADRYSSPGRRTLTGGGGSGGGGGGTGTGNSSSASSNATRESAGGGGGDGGHGSDTYGLDMEGEDDMMGRDGGAGGRDTAVRKGTRGRDDAGSQGDDNDNASWGILQYSEADLAQGNEEGDFGLVGQNDDGDGF